MLLKVGKNRKSLAVINQQRLIDNAIEIKISEVFNVIKCDEKFTQMQCYANDDVIIKGELAIPDDQFAVTLTNNSGMEAIFLIIVKDGNFTATLNFDFMGTYKFTNTEANLDLAPYTFKITPATIKVLKKTSDSVVTVNVSSPNPVVEPVVEEEVVPEEPITPVEETPVDPIVEEIIDESVVEEPVVEPIVEETPVVEEPAV